jgi:histidinol-phosphate/aromatic aminotransferase/cobyric acid decarboxylase-like protein
MKKESVSLNVNIITTNIQIARLKEKHDKELKKLRNLEQKLCHWQQHVTISRALDPSTNFLFHATKKLKKAKQDRELQQYLMNYCAFRVEEGDRDYEVTS